MIENTSGSTPPQKNPLASWFRQPKIYVRLPSKGKFYTASALDRSANEEYPVFAMTAKDELMFKTPDALLTGQSTVEVIKSCVPAIQEPWSMPSIDLDFLLIAIRIATYGDQMDIGCNCPSCNSENNYDISLQPWLELFHNFHYVDKIEIDPLVVKIRPYTYKELTKLSIKGLEQQKILNIVDDDALSEEQKLEKFGESFVRITELTIDVIVDCIVEIQTPDGSSTDKLQIKEFINNCAKDVFEKISTHVTEIKNQIEFKAQRMKCGECEHIFDLPITMDNSNFFAVRSSN